MGRPHSSAWSAWLAWLAAIVALVTVGCASSDVGPVGRTSEQLVTTVFRINSGGPAVAPFAADQYATGGSTFTTSSAVATSGVTNAAPTAVYQSERYGNHTYTFGSLTPNASYTVRLHFAEIYFTAAGSRLFNVVINGTQALTNFDIFATAGANKALVRDFTTQATSAGQIAIQYVSVKDNAKSSGIEILTSDSTNQAPTVSTAASANPNPTTGTTSTLSVLGADDGGEANLTYTWATTGTPPGSVTFSANGNNTAKTTTASFAATGTYNLQVTITDQGGLSTTSSVTVTVGTAPTLAPVIQVNSGGGLAGSFAADASFSGGSTYANNNTITTSSTPNAAPAAVYQSERYGNFSYTFSGLTASAAYTVRLHFAEIYWSSKGSRVFNVSVNGTQALSNFDIYAVAGQNTAVVRDVSTSANASGQIVVQYASVVDSAKSSGIEILTSNPPPTVSLTSSPLTVTSGGSATLSWSTSHATSCTASGGWSGSKATSGSQATGALTTSTTYTLTCTGGGGSASATVTVRVAAASATYPLKASANKRYLVDQNNVPFLILGDSPQSMIASLTPSQADAWFSHRKTQGFNSAWINLLCVEYTGGRADGSTIDGIVPFTTAGDLSTPNEAYFQRVDTIVGLAAQYGFLVLLDPIETGGWLPVLRSNGTAKARAYGQYLGNRYKNFDNIIWMNGNDFQSWSDANDDALVTAVAQGIQSVDTRHVQTVELDYYVSGSLNDANWAPIIGLNASYTYAPSYIQVLKDYNRTNFIPTFLIEGNYEGQTYAPAPTPVILRRQEYWTNLSGATGQLYGNRSNTEYTGLDTKMVSQLGYMNSLFSARAWYNLVPDQNHTVVTAGYGTFGGGSLFNEDSDYVTAARVADGSLALAYMPTARSITVDMSQLRGSVTARWYDPASGSFVAITGSPFQNSGTRVFAPPASNSDGDSDWVLVLESP
jgi:hypothetical protein